ncbi:MAG: ABC transporter permease [Gemmatimonadales bacterium]
MQRLWQDIRYAVRTLRKSPLFTAGVILTLALGIGINATMFSVVDTLFLRAPTDVKDPGRIVRVYFRQHSSYFGWYTQAGTSYPAFIDLRDRLPAFTQAAAIAGGTLSLGRGAEASQVRVAAVSHEYFPMLGLRTELGRFFGADDDRLGAPGVAVLSDGFWRRHFGADSTVIGRALSLGEGTYTVIGVGPPGFGGIDLAGVDAFLPIAASVDDFAEAAALGTRNWTWLSVVGRLAPGIRSADAASQATMVYRRGATADPEHAGRTAQLREDSSATVLLGPIQEARWPEASSDARVSAWIGAVALVVLLIACANVANLLLARGANRRRELAVRASLGAGRRRLILSMLVESFVLAVSGGVAAVLVATWTGTAARHFLLPALAPDVSLLNLRVMLFTAGAVLATALLTGLVPAIHASRTHLADSLRRGGHGTTHAGGRTRTLLLAAQIALTLTLLVGAGLFVRSLRNVEGIDLGFDADRVLMVHLDMASIGLPTALANADYLRLIRRVARIPGVERAGAAMGTPFGWSYSVSLRAEGRDSLPKSKSGGPYIEVVTPDYLPTLGTRILSGRGFSPGDVRGAGRVAVVGATFARMLWPGQQALGKCLYVGDSTAACTRVVGIAADAKRSQITDEAPLLYYVPLAQYGTTDSAADINALFVRTRGDATPLIGPVRREVQAAGNFPFAQIDRLADKAAPQLRSWRLGATAFTAFGALALLIAAMGIFAVISYSVLQRTKEIGVRVALGAQIPTVVRMIVVQGLRAAGMGILAGGVDAFVLGRAIAPLLYHVAPMDRIVIATVTAVLLVVAAAAAYLPARRAARIDPMIALRND